MNDREPTVNTKRRDALLNDKDISAKTSSLNKNFALKIQIRGRSDFLHEEVWQWP